ncbi:16082_t:CDS:2 [Gigaspora rosea]|nr:16082_t:CDS:2 [Gigaspora rosea]
MTALTHSDSLSSEFSEINNIDDEPEIVDLLANDQVIDTTDNNVEFQKIIENECPSVEKLYESTSYNCGPGKKLFIMIPLNEFLICHLIFNLYLKNMQACEQEYYNIYIEYAMQDAKLLPINCEQFNYFNLTAHYVLIEPNQFMSVFWSTNRASIFSFSLQIPVIWFFCSTGINEQPNFVFPERFMPYYGKAGKVQILF